MTYHDACSGLRELGVRRQPRRLLETVAGLRLCELPGAEVCCGFGGTFCVKYPEISDKMVGDKAAEIAATGAEAVLAGDLGCLLNIAGKLCRRGHPIEVRHVAEVLAGMTDGSGRRSARRAERVRTAPHARDQRAFQGQRRMRDSPTTNLQRALGLTRDRVSAAPPAGHRAAAGVRGAARGRAGDQGPHARASRFLSRALRNERRRPPGGKVHWARDAAEARDSVLRICRAAGARTVTKGKSMVAEEIGLNEHLEANGITPVETDLGEYIIQLRHEPPSHIIAPAIHLVKEQVAETFRAAHRALDPDRPLTSRGSSATRRATMLRPQFLAADVGITGANFLVAETGSGIIVTNEGNGDLTQTLPRVHIVLGEHREGGADASRTPRPCCACWRARRRGRRSPPTRRSRPARGGRATRRAGGIPRRPPRQRPLRLLGGEFQDMLRCIRCAACINHCPVYAAVGGHAYGWVYPGPMGAVLTPA